MFLRKKMVLVLSVLFFLSSTALSQDIIESVKNSDYEKVQALIYDNGKVVNTKDNRGCTPLHFAAENGYNEIAELLLKKGAEIDAGDINRNTPLHYAIMNGKTDLVDLLLKHGADINAQNKDKNAPLHLAAWYKQKSIIELLVEKFPVLERILEHPTIERLFRF